MKKKLFSFLFTLILLLVSNFALADEVGVSLTVKNDGDIVYSGTIPLSPTPSEDNVLSVIKQADALSPDFNISNIVHYSFGDYLKCIMISETELCDNWLYKVNEDSPMVGMDSYTLLGGENIVLYFGDENKAPAPVPEPEPETPPVHRSSGSYIRPPQVILPPPDVITTTSLPLPIPIELAPIQPNINLEEKPLEHNTTSESKTVTPLTYKKEAKKITKIVKQNTATVINTVSQTPPIAKTETIKKSWWNKFWDSIFSIF